MILAEVFIPALNRQYDFRLDEDVGIAELLEEIGAIVLGREEGETDGGREALVLCDLERKRVLPPEQTLRGCGIGSGCRLAVI